ncbi:helix-turn-helix transcriptional regulator [Thalassoglobus sp. JC818]|uniref:helix-turn-helix transcriptional regulator n=1 Tax=Thalassoglobus sp. JC818 TaxID=3232136 RepID=UPI00345A6164
MLKHFRERLGWTQAELAKKAGYSERLVSKAESGKAISKKTIEHLAEAVSTPTNVVFPEDLISDPVQIARKYIEGLYVHQADGFRHFRPYLDEDVEFYIAGDPQTVPFAGRYKGLEQIQALFKQFFSFIESPPNHDYEPHYKFIGQGNEVIVWGQSWLHPIGRPLTEPMELTQLMKFRRGKLYHFEDRYDTSLAEKLLNDQAHDSFDD